jgi:uncharacterized protein (UPF0276 family)
MYLPGLDDILEAGAGAFDYIELEPQTISRSRGGRLQLNRDSVAMLDAFPVPKLVHGVGAPIGGTVVREELLGPLFEAVAALDPPWVSEHLAFNHIASDGHTWFTGFMLPPLQVAGSVRLAASNITWLAESLRVPFAFETPVNYLKPRAGEMSDGAFIAAVAEGADCGILLDVHNLWCNESNGRQPVLDVVGELPLDRVWQMHIAGGTQVDGYWVDAHSGLVKEPVWDVAEQVVRRLPNLKAITFEAMPEYLWSDGISASEVVDELVRLRRLWRLRGSDGVPRNATEPAAAGVGSVEVTPEQWERALGAAVWRRHAPGTLADQLGGDPGTAIYRKLATSVRMGMVSDTLRLSYRLMVLTTSAEWVETLLNRYIGETSAQAIAFDEVRQFAGWLGRRGIEIEHLDEVVSFELATIATSATGEPRDVAFSCEPMELLQALGRGRLPSSETEGSYLVKLTP